MGSTRHTHSESGNSANTHEILSGKKTNFNNDSEENNQNDFKKKKIDDLKSKIKDSQKNTNTDNKNWVRKDVQDLKSIYTKEEIEFNHSNSKCIQNKTTQEDSLSIMKELEQIKRKKDMIAAIESDNCSIVDHLNEEVNRINSLNYNEDRHHEAIFSAPSSSLIKSSLQNSTTTDSFDLPLYKKLSKGDYVMAKYSDGKYYKAKIITTIQKNYPSARYDIQYEGYSGIETISWRDIQDVVDENKHENNKSIAVGRDEAASKDIRREVLVSNNVDDFGRVIPIQGVLSENIQPGDISALEKRALEAKSLSVNNNYEPSRNYSSHQQPELVFSKNHQAIQSDTINTDRINSIDLIEGIQQNRNLDDYVNKNLLQKRSGSWKTKQH